MKNKKNNDKVVLVVLDTGVAERFSDLISDSYEMCKVEDGTYRVEKTTGIDVHGHGSAVVNIIHSIENQLKIINFKICNCDNEITSQGITFALTYIYENLNVNIINLSAGTTYIDDYFEMKNICQKLYNKGVILISAFDNDGAVSYPAAFNNVIGVDCSVEYGSNDIIAISDSIIDVIFPQKYYRTYWNDGKKALLCGSSFACAYFSGLYGKYLLDNGEKDPRQFIQKISSRSLICKKSEKICGPSFEIKRAIVFPVNKETHAILRKKSELSFSLIGAFDDRLSGNVGKNLWGTVVQSFESIDWNADFDTVILSCVSDLERIVKKNYVNKIIDKCHIYSKQLYTFENIFIEKERSESVTNLSLPSCIFYPTISNNMIPFYKMNKLNHITAPIVGVFGTSSKQGKYTLQLELIKHLKRQQYKVGFLATEPSGYLFSADYTFHFGYHSHTDLSQRGIIAILNECLFGAQLNGADIIITGCQSATTHYDNSNIGQFCIEQYSFLLGTTPDFSVLCVNSHDELDYIERTISCIQSAGDGKVMALALLPKEVIRTSTNMIYSTKIIDNEELVKRKKYFSDRFSLPVYCIGLEEDIITLCNQIIEHFSEENL